MTSGAENPPSAKTSTRWPFVLLAVIVIGVCAYLMNQAQPEPPSRRVAFSDDPNALKVLFIGNSYTVLNELPTMFVQLSHAAKPQLPLKVDQVVMGGYSLEQHWREGRALRALRERGPWDYVVLQEQSLRPIEEPNKMFEFARLFDAEIKQAKAATVFYQTWARQDTPETQAILTKAYHNIATELHARVAPVGEAFATSKLRPQLYNPDKSHPSPLGTYLAACVFFATLHDQSPEALPYRDIIRERPWADTPEEDIRALQKLAWQVVQRDKAGAEAR